MKPIKSTSTGHKPPANINAFRRELDVITKGPRVSPAWVEIFNGWASGKIMYPRSLELPDYRRVNNDALFKKAAQTYLSEMGTFNHHYITNIPDLFYMHTNLAGALYLYQRQQNRPMTLHAASAGDATMERTVARLANHDPSGRLASNFTVLTNSANCYNRESFFGFDHVLDRTSGRLAPFQSHFYGGSFAKVNPYSLQNSPMLAAFRQGFDAFVDQTAFQMHSRDIETMSSFVKRTLKPDGLFIGIIKNSRPDEAIYREWEKKKDEFKSRFFSAKEIEGKDTKFLGQMKDLMVPLEDYAAQLGKNFEHVAVTSGSCNFHVITASNSASNLRQFIGNLLPPTVHPDFIDDVYPKVFQGLDGIVPSFRSAAATLI